MYVIMQEKYVSMQKKYVNIQDNDIDTQVIIDNILIEPVFKLTYFNLIKIYL